MFKTAMIPPRGDGVDNNGARAGPADRRRIVQTIAATGMGIVTALGLGILRQETADAKRKGGKRKAKMGAPGPQGATGATGAHGPAGPASGAFPGTINVRGKLDVVPSGEFVELLVQCPEPPAGERIVATGGGFIASSPNGIDGFLILSSRTNSYANSVAWTVSAINKTTSNSETIQANVICARYTA